MAGVGDGCGGAVCFGSELPEVIGLEMRESTSTRIVATWDMLNCNVELKTSNNKL